jgi:cytochrome c-type biogenesis protein CcmH
VIGALALAAFAWRCWPAPAARWLELFGAVLVFGLAGYAMAGQPGQPPRPRRQGKAGEQGEAMVEAAPRCWPHCCKSAAITW